MSGHLHAALVAWPLAVGSPLCAGLEGLPTCGFPSCGTRWRGGRAAESFAMRVRRPRGLGRLADEFGSAAVDLSLLVRVRASSCPALTARYPNPPGPRSCCGWWVSRRQGASSRPDRAPPTTFNPSQAFAAATHGTPALPFYYVRLQHGQADFVRFEVAGAELDHHLTHPSAAVTPVARLTRRLNRLVARDLPGGGFSLVRDAPAERRDGPTRPGRCGRDRSGVGTMTDLSTPGGWTAPPMPSPILGQVIRYAQTGNDLLHAFQRRRARLPA